MTEPGPELKTLSFLRALPAASRAELLQNAVVHAVTPGTVLFEQGEMPTFQYVVLAGSVHLLGRSSAGREVLIEVVEPPDLDHPGRSRYRIALSDAGPRPRAVAAPPDPRGRVPQRHAARAAAGAGSDRQPRRAVPTLGATGQEPEAPHRHRSCRMLSPRVVQAARHAAPGHSAVREEPDRVGTRNDTRELFARPVGAPG